MNLRDDMPINVRTATRADIPAIVEANCSDVKEWFHWSRSGRGEPASYDELRDWERRMHGGEWMDVGLLNRYWDELELYGVIPLVAELEGKVVGHLDVIASREPSFGRFLWLDVLMVHREYRRRGVATALIRHAEEIAKKEGLDAMMVYPEDYEGPSGLLYRSVSFERFRELHTVDIECLKGDIPDKIALVSLRMDQQPPLDTHEMICGRANISQKMWRFGQLQSHVHDPITSHDIMLGAVTEAGTYYFRLSTWFPRKKGYLALWCPLKVETARVAEVVSVVRMLGLVIGIDRLESTVLERDLETLSQLRFQDRGMYSSPLMRKTLTP